MSEELKAVPIPLAAGSDRLPVLSAVRVGISDRPAEFIAIADCGEGTPTHRYATQRLYVWPEGRTVARDGIYNLTWQDAQASLIARAKLTPAPKAEVVVFAAEPHEPDAVHIFIDGTPATTPPPVEVTTHVVRLDYDDEEDLWLIHALEGIDHLSPDAQRTITGVITSIADERELDLDVLREEYASL